MCVCVCVCVCVLVLQWVDGMKGLYLKKNMTVTGSYNSYIVLKSGTSEMSTR